MDWVGVLTLWWIDYNVSEPRRFVARRAAAVLPAAGGLSGAVAGR